MLMPMKDTSDTLDIYAYKGCIEHLGYFCLLINESNMMNHLPIFTLESHFSLLPHWLSRRSEDGGKDINDNLETSLKTSP